VGFAAQAIGGRKAKGSVARYQNDR
jgi:hypothetical protein